MKNLIVLLVLFSFIFTPFYVSADLSIKQQYDKYDSITNFNFSSNNWEDYIFLAKKWEDYFIIKNWKEEKVISKDVSSLIFSPNKESYAYISIINKKIVIIKDWIYSNSYDYNQNPLEYAKIQMSLMYSLDSNSFSFAVKKNWQDIIVKDWIELNPYNEWAYWFVYSSDSKSFSYIAKKNWKQVVIKDWVKIWNEYEKITKLLYSPDSKSLSFIAKKDWKQVIVRDWIESNLYDSINDIDYSFDSSKFYIFTEKGWKELLITDWIEWKLYDDIIKYIVSPFNNSISYIAEKEWKKLVIKDWIESNSYNSIDWNSLLYFSNWDLIFNAWWKYIVKNLSDIYNIDNNDWIREYYYSIIWNSLLFTTNNWNLIKDNVKIDSWDFINCKLLKYSSNGKSFVYSKGKNNFKCILNKDWVENDSYDKILNFEYSQDWNHYFFIWKSYSKEYPHPYSYENNINNYTELAKLINLAEENAKYFIVKDWIESKTYNKIESPVFLPNNKWFIYIAQKDNKYTLVKDWVENGLYDSIKFLEYSQDWNFIAYVVKNNNKETLIISNLSDSITQNKIITNNYNLSEKDLKVVLNVSKTIKKFSISKQNKYKKALSNLLLKQKEWTRNFELIKAILEKIK